MNQQTASLRGDVLAHITDYIGSRGDVDVDQVREEAVPSHLDIVSLDLVAMAQVLQDEFKTRIDDQDIVSVKTIGDLVTFAVDRLGRGAGAQQVR